MNNQSKTLKERDEFDILPAVWVLSCNDENPIITYDLIFDQIEVISIPD